MKKCLCCDKLLLENQIAKHNQFCSKSCATSYRQKSHDPDIFDIDNEDLLYYILGLIFTDGNLDKDESRITLSLTDKNVVSSIYPVFCDTSKRKIYTYQPKGSINYNITYTVINSNKDTIEKLKNMTLKPHNSVTKKFPKIPSKNLGSFIRGVFDGDGCVFVSNEYKGKKYKKISITCASKEFVDGLVDVLQNLGYHPTVVIDSRRRQNDIKTYYVCINRQHEINSLKEFMYHNESVCIKNKKSIFEVA